MPAIDISKIHEGLFQGAWPPFGNELAKRGFDVVVLCANENQHEEMYHDVQVICAPGDDDHRVNRMMRFLPTWMLAAQRVAQLHGTGKKILVTCMAGLNRSGMVTAMALYLLTGWDGAKVVQHVQQMRADALCNETFANWLRENLKASDAPVLPTIDVESPA